VMERREHEQSRSIMSGIFCGVEWFQISGEYFFYFGMASLLTFQSNSSKNEMTPNHFTPPSNQPNATLISRGTDFSAVLPSNVRSVANGPRTPASPHANELTSDGITAGEPRACHAPHGPPTAHGVHTHNSDAPPTAPPRPPSRRTRGRQRGIRATSGRRGGDGLTPATPSSPFPGPFLSHRRHDDGTHRSSIALPWGLLRLRILHSITPPHRHRRSRNTTRSHRELQLEPPFTSPTKNISLKAHKPMRFSQ
jgi:hypothetical protein